MPWVTRELPNGKIERIWVQPKPAVKKKKKPPKPAPKKKAGQSNAAKAAVNAAARRAAKLALKRAAERRQRLNAQRDAARRQRSLAYDVLRRKQAAIARQQAQVSVRARDIRDETGRRDTRLRRDSRLAPSPRDVKPLSVAQQKARDEYYAEWGRRYKREQAIRRALHTPDGDKNYKDENRLRDLENIIREEAKNPDKPADPKLLEALDDRLVKLADRIQKRREEAVKKLKAKLDSYDPNKKWTNADVRETKRLYNEYLAANAAFVETFGDGTPDNQGSFNRYLTARQKAALNQRDWWKRQMRSEFERTIANNDGRAGSEERAVEAQRMLDLLDGKTETSWIEDPEVPGGRRKRTPEEELEYRQSLVIQQQERMLAEQRKQQQKEKLYARFDNLVQNSRGEYVDRAAQDMDRRMNEVKAKLYPSGETPSFKNPADVQRFADEVLASWLRDHPRPPGLLGGGGKGPAAANTGQDAKIRAWQAAFERAQREAYAPFGVSNPMVLERVMQLPGVDGLLGILDSIIASYGTGMRIAQKATSGSSRGRFDPNAFDWGELPTGIKKQLGLDGPLAGIRDIADRLGGPFAPFAQVNKAMVLGDWLQSPSGKEWMQKRIDSLPDKQAQEAEEWSNFLQGLGKENFSERYAAIRQFGITPSWNETNNLLFQLLDPGNAIPLNFTKYVARGKAAIEAFNTTKGVAKPYAALKKFALTSEQDLGAVRFADSLIKDMKAKNLTPEQAADELVQSLVSPAEKLDFARRLGLETEEISAQQVRAFIEKRLLDRAEGRNIDVATEARELAERAAKQERDSAEARARLLREKQQASPQRDSAEQRNLDRGVAAAQRLAADREEQLKRVQARAEREAARPLRPEPPKKRIATKRRPKRVQVNGPEDVALDTVVDSVDTKIRLRVTEAETKAGPTRTPKAPIRRKNIRPFRGGDEFWADGPFGTRLPRAYVKSLLENPKLKALIAKGEAGDKLAREQAEAIIHRQRMVEATARDDLGLRESHHTTSEEDYMERAGVLGNAEAERVVRENRAAIRWLSRNIGRIRKEGKKLTAEQFEDRLDQHIRPIRVRLSLADAKVSAPKVVPVERPESLLRAMRDAKAQVKRIEEKVRRIEYQLERLAAAGGDYLDMEPGRILHREWREKLVKAEQRLEELKHRQSKTLSPVRAIPPKIDPESLPTIDGPVRVYPIHAGDAHELPSAEYLRIGEEFASEDAANSLRGLKDLYQPFSDRALKHYTDNPNAPEIYRRVRDINWLRDLKDSDIRQLFNSLHSGDYGVGAVGFRDAGTILFEIFHTLRLDLKANAGSIVRSDAERAADAAKTKDVLARFNAIAALAIDEPVVGQTRVRGKFSKGYKTLQKERAEIIGEEVDDPLFAHMWRVMWDRAGLGGGGNYRTNEAGFRLAAEKWGLEPYLSLAAIPNGYRAQLPPLRFGLAPRLEALIDDPKVPFRPADKTWNFETMRESVSAIINNGGKARNGRVVYHATQVVHYMAERWGDLTKASPLRARISEEILARVIKQMGRNEVAAIFSKPGYFYRNATAYRLAGGDPARAQKAVFDMLNDHWGGKSNKPSAKHGPRRFNPDIADLVMDAYWKGDITIGREPPNAELHKLLYLLAIQSGEDTRLYLRQSERFMAEMKEIGKLDEARELVMALNRVEIERNSHRLIKQIDVNFNPRRSAEKLEEEAERLMLAGIEASATLKFLHHNGMLPDASRLVADARYRHRVAQSIEENIALESERGSWWDDLTDDEILQGLKPDDDGNVSLFDIDDRVRHVQDVMARFHAEKDPFLKKKELRRARDMVFRIIDDYLANSGARLSSGDYERFVAMADDIAEFPALLESIRRELTDYLIDARRATTTEAIIWEETILRLRLDVLRYKGGTPDQIQRAVERLNQHYADVAKYNSRHPRKLTDALVGERGAVLAKLPNASAEERALIEARIVEIDKRLDEVYAKLKRNDQYQQTLPEAQAKRDEYLDVVDEENPLYIEAFEPSLKPQPPTNGETVRETMVHDLLQRLGRMTEEESWSAAEARAKRILNSASASAGAKDKARQTLNDVAAARLADRIHKDRQTRRPSGPRRQRFAKRIDALLGKEVEELMPGKRIATFASNQQSVVVNHIRSMNNFLKGSFEVVPGAQQLGPGNTLDYFPIELFDEVNAEITEAIRKLHHGETRGTQTRLRRASTSDGEYNVTFHDKDPKVLKVKKEVLARHGISLGAYDEARSIFLKTGWQRRRKGHQLVRLAGAIARGTKEKYDDVFLRLRDEAARKEARDLLGVMARGEYFDYPPEVILSHFRSAYVDSKDLQRGVANVSEFQLRTLQRAMKDTAKNYAGVDDLTEEALGNLLRLGDLPPFEKGRDAVREWLVKHGEWSPRQAEDIATGKKSWSIEEEAAYWETNFGVVPPWADLPAMQIGENGRTIFNDPEYRYRKFEEWGMFGRSIEVRARLEGVAREDLIDAHVRGNEELGIKHTRELELQRRYAVERYGDAVGQADGAGGYKLWEMPDLMYPEEFRAYQAKQLAEGTSIARSLAQTDEEVDAIEELIAKAIDKHFPALEAKFAAGEGITYQDVGLMVFDIQREVLADPRFANRGKSILGRMLDLYTASVRWAAFGNPSFLTLNAVDTPVKMGLYKYRTRGLHLDGLGAAGDLERARGLELHHFGEELVSTTYDLRQRKAIDYMRSRHPKYDRFKQLGTALSAVEGVFRSIPEASSRVEVAGKLQLAREAYPQVISLMRKRLAATGVVDEDLAHLMAIKFIKKDIWGYWPTVGDGPIERLWNRFFPFFSYNIKNKTFFIKYAAENPMILAYAQRFGEAIERVNRERWAEENPEAELPDWAARKIELPWAPGVFMDLGELSDAGRGIKPLFGGQKTTAELFNQWFRIVNPVHQAGFALLFNSLGVTKMRRWKPIIGDDGFPTGEYEEVWTGWNEPWSNNQPRLGSVFWMAEAADSMAAFFPDGLTSSEASLLASQVLLFGNFRAVDEGGVYYMHYNMLKQKDPDAAKRWLEETDKGKMLKLWLAAKAAELRATKDPFAGIENDEFAWWNSLDALAQERVKLAQDKIGDIRRLFSANMLELDPRSGEYKNMKATMYAEIASVYLQYPELMAQEVWSKTPQDWAKNMAEWQTDRMVDAFFDLADLRPKRDQYKTRAEYNKATEAWEQEKARFLAQHPQVRDRIADDRAEVAKLREDIEKRWDELLGDIDERNEAIEAIDKILKEKDYEGTEGLERKKDFLYLQNELDYESLQQDYFAKYFHYEDFERTTKIGPWKLKDGLSPLIERVMGFDSAVYEKAKREGRLVEYFKNEKYAQSLAKAMMFAKGGHRLGKFDPKKWGEYLANNKEFRDLYFWKNPEKRAPWEKQQEYIRHISVWGKLVGAERWDEAGRVWDNLPIWVRQQYLDTHPDSKMTLSGPGGGTAVFHNGQWFKSAASRDRFVLGTQYFAYMKRWASHFDSPDKGAAMRYFDSLPQWVKERYFKKHPENRIKFETSAAMSRKLAEYFAGDEEMRARYLKANPDLARWLAKHSNTKDWERIAILQAYRNIPSSEAWLRRVFREKYPEIFSQEAAGKRRLKSVYNQLSEHPEMLPGFEKWVEAIWETYAEMLKHAPRPKNAEILYKRNVPGRKYYRKSKSAAQTSV